MFENKGVAVRASNAGRQPVDAALQEQDGGIANGGTARDDPAHGGLLVIRCNDLEDLLRQLVLLAKARIPIMKVFGR